MKFSNFGIVFVFHTSELCCWLFCSKDSFIQSLSSSELHWEIVCQKTKTPCLLFLEADSLGIWEFCYLGVDTEPLLEKLGLFVTH